LPTYPMDCRNIISCITHEDGKNIVVVLRDISDLKSTEEQLRSANYLSNLYLDIMSHDIRNYLQEIVLSADLLSETRDLDNISHTLDLISESVAKCENLIKNVSVTAELPKRALIPKNLLLVINDCISEFKEIHKDMEIHLDSKVASAEVLADEFLSLLVMNLLNNAVAHGKGKTSQIWIELKEHIEYIILSIADDGPGIPDKRKQVLFDAERRFGGVGIHQVKQIVNKYSGNIEVTDRIPGDHTSGVRFTIWLPRTEIK